MLPRCVFSSALHLARGPPRAPAQGTRTLRCLVPAPATCPGRPRACPCDSVARVAFDPIPGRLHPQAPSVGLPTVISGRYPEPARYPAPLICLASGLASPGRRRPVPRLCPRRHLPGVSRDPGSPRPAYPWYCAPAIWRGSWRSPILWRGSWRPAIRQGSCFGLPSRLTEHPPPSCPGMPEASPLCPQRSIPLAAPHLPCPDPPPPPLHARACPDSAPSSLLRRPPRCSPAAGASGEPTVLTRRPSNASVTAAPATHPSP